MTLKELKTLLDGTGLPVAYGFFEQPQTLPYIVYEVTGSDNFAADNKVWLAKNRIQIELYTKNKDLETEAKVENALASVFWEKSEEYIESLHCMQVVYEIEV